MLQGSRYQEDDASRWPSAAVGWLRSVAAVATGLAAALSMSSAHGVTSSHMGQTLVVPPPPGYCELGGTPAEDEAVRLHRKSVPKGSDWPQVAAFFVLCSERDALREAAQTGGALYDLSEWVAVAVSPIFSPELLANMSPTEFSSLLAEIFAERSGSSKASSDHASERETGGQASEGRMEANLSRPLMQGELRVLGVAGDVLYYAEQPGPLEGSAKSPGVTLAGVTVVNKLAVMFGAGTTRHDLDPKQRLELVRRFVEQSRVATEAAR